jgi:hypothetical protein
MINRLKAAGVVATAALLALAVFAAMNGLPGSDTHDRAIPAGNLQPDAGNAGPLPASQGAICMKCMNPAAHETGATAVAFNEDIPVRADTSAAEPDRLPELVLVGCCTGAHLAAAAEEADEDADTYAEAGSSSRPFATVAATVASTGMQTTAGTALTGGGGSTGAVTGGGSTRGETETAPSEKNDEPVDVLESTGPGSDDKKFVYAPDGGYCINPVGIYCGATDKTVDSGQPDDKTETPGPDLPQASRLVPPEQDKPKDVPEPLTLALLGIGLAGLRVTRIRSQ